MLFTRAAGTSFFTDRLDAERHDALRIGQAVRLRYLRCQDTPAMPLSNFPREMHALPIVRLAGDRAFSGAGRFFTPRVTLVCEALAGAVILPFVLRVTRSRLFGWVAGICVVLGVGALAV